MPIIVRSVKKIAVFIVLLILITGAVFTKNVCNSFGAVNSFGKWPIFDKGALSDGYILITPLSQRSDIKVKNNIYLTDSYGRAVKTWEVGNGTFYSVLKKNGNLISSQIDDSKKEVELPTRGNTGIIQELDWNNNVVWEYKNSQMHHDFKTLPNDNVVVTVWEKIPKNISDKIKGGIPNSEFKGEIWGDKIVEIDKEGKEVWSWSAYEHLDPELDPFPEYTTRSAWTLINSLDYLTKDPIEGKEAYLVSLRVQNKLLIVRKEDGKVIWKSPVGMVSGQHDPTLLENGNILVFNNNISDIYKNPPAGSNILEINPKENSIVWKLENGNKGLENNRFFSYLVGGTQKMSNGNIFVVDGQKGHLFEVTQDKKLVWDLINPYSTPATGLWPNNAMFKAKKYNDSDVEWPQRLSSSKPWSGDICVKILN